MTWTIERGSGILVHSQGRTEMTRTEFNRQSWPGCPVCGRQIVVDPISSGDAGSTVDKVMPGNWDCQQRCDVGAALREG